jgi:hypothetical protein
VKRVGGLAQHRANGLRPGKPAIPSGGENTQTSQVPFVAK